MLGNRDIFRDKKSLSKDIRYCNPLTILFKTDVTGIKKILTKIRLNANLVKT